MQKQSWFITACFEKFHSSSSWGIFLLVKCKIFLTDAEFLPMNSKQPWAKHQWHYQGTVSVQIWVLLRSACAFELCFLDHISAGTRAFNFVASCHQHVLLHWIPVAIFQTLPASMTGWVWVIVGSCKHQTVHNSFSSSELYLGFLLSMSKALFYHLLLPMDKLSIRRSLPAQLVTKKNPKQASLLKTSLF